MIGLLRGFIVRKYTGSRSVGRTRKRWNNNVKDCFRKTGLDVGQAMFQGRSVWLSFARGNAWSVARRGTLVFDEIS